MERYGIRRTRVERLQTPLEIEHRVIQGNLDSDLLTGPFLCQGKLKTRDYMRLLGDGFGAGAGWTGAAVAPTDGVGEIVEV
jgi:hypothetical protein